MKCCFPLYTIVLNAEIKDDFFQLYIKIINPFRHKKIVKCKSKRFKTEFSND